MAKKKTYSKFVQEKIDERERSAIRVQRKEDEHERERDVSAQRKAAEEGRAATERRGYKSVLNKPVVGPPTSAPTVARLSVRDRMRSHGRVSG